MWDDHRSVDVWEKSTDLKPNSFKFLRPIQFLKRRLSKYRTKELKSNIWNKGCTESAKEFTEITKSLVKQQNYHPEEERQYELTHIDDSLQ